MQGKKKWLRMVVALVLMAVLVLGLTVTAFAATGITYIDADGKEQTASSYNTTLPTSGSISGVYYLTGSKTITGVITLSGNTTFIVASGANYTFNKRISGSSYDLCIYNEKGSTGGMITITGSDGSKGTAGANGIESYNRYQYNDRCGKTGGTGYGGDCALYVKNLSVSNVTVTCTGGAGGQGGDGGSGYHSGSTGYPGAGGSGGTGGQGGNAITLRGGLNLYGGTLNATGGQGGQGGRGGHGGNGNKYNDAHGGHGGNAGNGGYGINLAESSSSISVRGNGTLNATGGKGGSGGAGEQGGYSAPGYWAGGNGGNGGDGGTGNYGVYSVYNCSFNIDSGKATLQSGEGGIRGPYGYPYSSSSGGGSVGSYGNPGGRAYAIYNMTNNFDTLSIHRGGVSSTSVYGWNASSVNSYYYIYVENMKYTVTLDNQSATTAGTTSVKATYGFAMPAITVPAKTGYTFNGYYDAASDGTLYYNADGTSAKNWDKASTATLYAQWTANEYTVTLKDGESESTVTATYGSAMPTATMPTKTGYTFNGYFDAQTGGTKYYNANGSSAKNWDKTSNTTLYAQWTPNTYTVTLDGQGATTAGSTSVTATYNAAMPSATMPAKTGYTFNGYYDAASDGTQYYKADGTSARAWDKAENTTLYAQWTEHTATLTYNANGHGTAPEAVTMKFTEATNAGAAITGVTGYTFNGWNTAADGKGQSYAAGDVVKAANVDPAATTLYAQWTPKTYTVTLGNGEGSGDSSVTATYDAVLPDVTVPVWEKHVFCGYYTEADGEGTQYIDKDGKGVKAWDKTSDTTLYAHWLDSVSIDGLSLLLDGDIGLWFHVTVNDEALKAGSYMMLTIGSKSDRTETVYLIDTETVDLTDKTPKDESGRYLFAFDVNSIQLAEKVTATFYDANGTVYDTKSQSVEDYYKLIKDQSTNENEKALVKALVNYGYYAQQALSKTNGWVIGKDYATSTKQDGDLITGNLDAYKPVITGSSTHVTGLNVSLLLDNKTTLCLYFTTSDKEMPRVTIDGGSELTPIVYGEQDPTITDGKVTNIEQMSDGRWLVRISNIDALHLGDVHTVTADGRTIYLSALSYGSVIGGTENINAIRALADYYQAALTYAGKTVMTEATVENTAYTYTGHAITPTVTVKAGETPLTEAQYTVTWSGNLTDAGTYTGVITSNDDRILGSLKVTFTIAPKMIDVPTAVSGLVYDHTGKTGVIDGEGYWLMNNVETLAGSFNAVATLNANYCWSDGTTAPKTIPWSIAKQEIAVPEPFTDLIYNGENQLCVHDAPDCTLTGVYQATNAGEYTMTATLKDTANTCWADGTTDAKSITWSIAKATPTANGEISITYYTNGGSFTVTGGQMSVDGTFSFETAPTANGTATATFTPNDSTNYETVNTDAKVTVITTPVTTAVKIGG